MQQNWNSRENDWIQVISHEDGSEMETLSFEISRMI